MSKKVILHLCADIGSDSKYYQLDPEYEVIRIGIDIGVENYSPEGPVYGVIANPVCTELSTAGGFDKTCDIEKGMFLVNHCRRIIKEANPVWWVLENPAKGMLKTVMGKPKYVYQPWWYGSPWTKQTGLWGEFNIPPRKFLKWEEVPNKIELWKRKGRKIPGLVYLHKSAVDLIPEFQWAKDRILHDRDLRSMCSDGFARAFYECNP